MMFFRDLGRAVAEAWRRTHFDSAAFPDIARELLSKSQPSVNVDPAEVITWVTKADTMPRQVRDHKFADLNLVTYRGQRFYIEVLFWTNGTTSVHQHAFSGAFCVMAGSSLHTTFDFRKERDVGDGMCVGKLRRKNAELLRTGDVRPILSGPDGTIHSLFHLDKPSVTVVIRTNFEGTGGPQFDYSPSGIGLDPFWENDVTARRRELLNMLDALSRERYGAHLRELLRASVGCEQVALLNDASRHYRANHKQFEALIVETLDPSLAPYVRAYFEERRRLAHIVERRKRIVDPAHRFFLALLLNAQNRHDCLKLVTQRYGETCATDMLVRWFDDLQRADAEEGDNSLGFICDDLGRAVFQELLSGASPEQIVGSASSKFASLGVDSIPSRVHELTGLFRGSFLYRNILQEQS